MWLACPDDVVVAAAPSTRFLGACAAAGFGAPQFVDAPERARLPNGRAGELCPWGWSPRIARRLAGLGGRWDPRAAVVSSKLWAAERAREVLGAVDVPTDPADLGVACATFAEVEAAVGGRRVWVKSPWSAAGSHRVRLAGSIDPRAARWIERSLAEGPLLVEPDLDVELELSVLGEVGREGVRVRGVTRFVARGGVYRGTVIGPPELGCTAEARRFLHEPRSGAVHRALARVAEAVGAAAASLGHQGPFGVDAIVARGANGLRLKPISEVNGRTTMGHVALALRRRIAGGSVGAWLFVPRRALAGRLPDDPPRAADGLVREGILPTTDPERAEAITTWLVVDRCWEGVRARWQRQIELAADPEALRAATGWL
jgi:hypothetical protein